MTYSLIIPIYNEKRTLLSLFKKLDRLDDKIEIIIVDDGSNDGTKDLLIESNQFIIMRNEFNTGKGNAITNGVELATNQNIIIMDGDLEVNTDDIPMLINKFELNNIDALVGIRWKKNDNNIRLDMNTLGNYLINSFFNFLYNSNLNDVLCCVKILDVNLFKSLSLQSNGFSIEGEIMAKLVLGGYDIKEVDVHYKRRTLQEGKKLKFSDGWNIIWTMLKIRLLTKSN